MTQGRHVFFFASNGRLGARSHLRNSLGRKPSRFVSSLECCLGARKHRGEALSSTSSPHQKFRKWSCFARAPYRSQFGAIKGQLPSRASTCVSLRTLLEGIRNLCDKNNISSSPFSKIYSSHPGISSFMAQLRLAENHKLQQTYRTAIAKPLQNHKPQVSQNWSRAKSHVL